MISIVTEISHNYTIETLQNMYPNSKRIHFIYINFLYLLTQNKDSYNFHNDNYYYIYNYIGYIVYFSVYPDTHINVLYMRSNDKCINYNKYFCNNNINYTTRFKLFIYHKYFEIQDKFYNVNSSYTKNIHNIKNINMIRLYHNIYYI